MALAALPRRDEAAREHLDNVARRARPVVFAHERTIPVDAGVGDLLPWRGVQRGTVVAVDGPRGAGATTVALQLAAAATAAGEWAAAVDPDASLGGLAAAETGVDVERFVVVRGVAPARWVEVVGALLDGVALVVAGVPAGVRAGDARRLVGRARERSAVLVALGPWPVEAAVRLCAGGGRWPGLGRALDADRFRAASGSALEPLLGDERFTGVRWWGEMTTTLIAHGEREAGLAAEHLADATAKRYGVRVLCSCPCDRYDAQAYGAQLSELCSAHSHVIPAEDYVRHRLAVNRAIAEVIGELKGSVLQSLASWRGLGCSLPSSQALLFWLRDAMPERFEAVLERARTHHTHGGAPS